MKQTFIMIVGFSGSGRSTLAQKLHNSFKSKTAVVDVKKIHEFLNSTYSVFQDDNTVEGDAFELRQDVSDAVEKAVITSFISNGESVIYDSANLKKSKRTQILNLVEEIQPGLRTVVIEIRVAEKLILDELKGRDKEAESRGLVPVWMDLYEKIQKPQYQKPTKAEADLVMQYDRTNLKEIMNKISKL